jgi:hypothetical protein
VKPFSGTITLFFPKSKVILRHHNSYRFQKIRSLSGTITLIISNKIKPSSGTITLVSKKEAILRNPYDLCQAWIKILCLCVRAP